MQRVVKFVKYLSEYGWQSIVLAPRSGNYPAADQSMLSEIPDDTKVYKTNTFEPVGLYKSFTGTRKDRQIPLAVLNEENISLSKKIANSVRLNLFIPDAKIGWKYFAVKTGKEIIKSEKPDIILSSSPPPTVQLIAHDLAQWSGLPWVADFRDPWTKIFYYDKMPRWQLAEKRDRRLEKKVLKQADKIVVVNKGFFEADTDAETVQIPNGFDSADRPVNLKNQKNLKFTIRYMGSFKPKQQVESLPFLLKKLSDDPNMSGRIRVEFYGQTDMAIQQNLLHHKFNTELNFYDYVDHNKALELMYGADMLLLVIGKSENAGVISGTKTFEYIMAEKPILAFGPVEGQASKILQETASGKMFDYSDANSAFEFIKTHFTSWQKNKIDFHPDLDKIEKYDRKNLSKQLANILEGLT